jgi:hypothetical protein
MAERLGQKDDEDSSRKDAKSQRDGKTTNEPNFTNELGRADSRHSAHSWFLFIFCASAALREARSFARFLFSS